MDAAIELQNLTLGYDRHPAVHHVDQVIPSGSLVAVVGPNGAGKTTLLRGIAGMIKPLQGAVRMAGDGKRSVAYLPQRTEIDREFPMTVYELAAMGLWPRVGAFASVTSSMRGKVLAALESVGMKGQEKRIVGTLSGGQLQRTLFARLLLQDAQIVLIDEPFVALEAQVVADLIAIVRRWHAEGRTVVAVLHDHDEVRRGFPDTLILARELIAYGPTAEILTDENLKTARQMFLGDHDSQFFDDHEHGINATRISYMVCERSPPARPKLEMDSR